jgi:DNA-binding winged helix-turn-helix (wHTH) protein/Tol biopolymer transport system component
MEGKGLLEFGPFRVDTARRMLLRDGQVVSLPGKAFDVLLALLRTPGDTVSKDDLMKTVWPDSFVEEGNLTQTVFVLRKALGDSDGQALIVTAPRVGYRFVGNVTTVSPVPGEAPAAEAPEVPSKPARRAVLPWGIAAGLALIVPAAGWLALRSPRPPSAPFLSLSVDLGTTELAPRSGVALAPDGTRIVFSVRTSEGKSMLAVRMLDGSAITPLPETAGGTDPFFSPDGQWIAYWADGKLKKTSIHGGRTATVCEDCIPGGGASWSENGAFIVATQHSPFGLSRIDSGGGAPHLIASPADHKALCLQWPQVLPGGETVLYTASDRLRSFEDARIEVLSLKTGRWKTLQEKAYYGRYLPSGHLVWVQDRKLFGARFELARLEMKGPPAPLIDDDLGNPVVGNGEFDFSQNGAFIYLGGNVPKWQVVWIDPAGRTDPLISNAAYYRDPSLSPDGKRLALAIGQSHSDIYLYDLERQSLTRRSFTKESTREPAWSSDGLHIAFKSNTPNGGTILWMRSDIGEPQLVYKAAGAVDRFAISPDSKSLLVALSGPDIWMVPLDISDPDRPKGGKPELFLHRTQPGFTASFSQDGRWIAYSSHEPGETGIYVRSAAAGRFERMQISFGKDDFFPLWSRSADQILFQDDEGHIEVIDYQVNGASFRAGKQRLWLSKPIAAGNRRLFFDLAPDGKRIVTFERAKNDASLGSLRAMFLFNFFDELRRRVPDKGP